MPVQLFQIILIFHIWKIKKHAEQFTCLLSDSDTGNGTKRKQSKKRSRNRKRKERKQKKKKLNALLEANKEHNENLSNQELTNDQMLKFVPYPITKETQMRQQLLRDYENFARRMRLPYFFHVHDKEPHPFHVKST